jgi:hypothetical protein
MQERDVVILCLFSLFFHHVPIAPDLWEAVYSIQPTCREDDRIGIRYGCVNNSLPDLLFLTKFIVTQPPHQVHAGLAGE